MIAIAGVALPSFFLALVLQIVFFRVLHLLPVSGQLSITMSVGATRSRKSPAWSSSMHSITANWVAFWDGLQHLILPTLALAPTPPA